MNKPYQLLEAETVIDEVHAASFSAAREAIARRFGATSWTDLLMREYHARHGFRRLSVRRA